jgi:hypothetical protein
VLGREASGAAEGGRLAGDIDIVLERHRHAEQRQPLARPQAALGQACFRAGRLRAQEAEGIERLLRGRDSLQGRVEQLDRADLALGEQLRLPGQVVSLIPGP